MKDRVRGIPSLHMNLIDLSTDPGLMPRLITFPCSE
jgi:hypothetical protein